MPFVKYKCFFRNMFFGQKSRLSMQKFLCEMSENGYHLVKITRTKCVFSEEVSKRFVYSLCADGDDQLYTQGDEWRELLTFKGIRFFQKEVPPSSVSIERDFDRKRIKAEKLWLDARLAEGLILVDTLDSEYVFRRDSSFAEYEYYLARPQKKKKKKNEPAADPLAEARSMRFMTVSNDGATYYFLNNSGVRRSGRPEKGRRLTDQLLALFIATGSALAFCAATLLSIFGAISANVNGSSPLPWILGGSGAAIAFATLFVVFFLRFQRISELRRISAEEARAREAMASVGAEEPKAPEPPSVNETNNNNNIVMNTVVLNNYGDKKDAKSLSGDEFDPNLQAVMGQVFGQSAALANDPATVAPAAPVYEVRTQNENDIWQGTEVFGEPEAPSAPQPAPDEQPDPVRAVKTSAFDDEDWISADTDEADEDSDGCGEELDESLGGGGFPILSFVGYAVLCFASVAVFTLGLRFGIGWFASSDKSNILTLALSALGVAFSPFVGYNAFTACKDLLSDTEYEEE